MLGAARFMGTLVALSEAGAIVAQLEGAALYGNQTIMRNRTKRFQSPMTILRR